MTNDQKEVLELAKAHNAIVEPVESGLTMAFYESEFFAFAAALEEKHRAKIAMLMEEINILVSDTPAGIWTNEYRHRHDKAISATQQDTDAFIAEVRERERMNIAEQLQIACANGDLPDACEDAADYIISNSAAQPRTVVDCKRLDGGTECNSFGPCDGCHNAVMGGTTTQPEVRGQQ